MKKIVIFAPFGYLILGLFLIFDAVGGTAFVREVLGLVETYPEEMEEFTLFHPNYLTSAKDLVLDKSSTAQHFKEMSTCHQSIKTPYCYQILKKNV